MNFLNSRPALLAIASVMIIAGTASAHAQQQQNGQFSGAIETATSVQSTAAMDFSDEQIDAYARSAVAITNIHSQMAPKIKAATKEKERDRMFIDMQKQMASAVDSTDGITVDDYNEISRQARQNPQLAIRIRDEVMTRLQ